jgi:hypothetical protein
MTRCDARREFRRRRLAKRPSAQYGERSSGRVKKLPLFRFAAALVEWLVRKLAYELTVSNSTTARFHFFAGFGADHLFTGSSESCRGCEQGSREQS